MGNVAVKVSFSNVVYILFLFLYDTNKKGKYNSPFMSKVETNLERNWLKWDVDKPVPLSFL